MRSSKFNTSFTITSQGVVLQLRIARYAFWESKIGLPLFSSTTTNHRLYYTQKIGHLQRRKTQQCRKFQVVPFSRCFAVRQNSKFKIGHGCTILQWHGCRWFHSLRVCNANSKLKNVHGCPIISRTGCPVVPFSRCFAVRQNSKLKNVHGCTFFSE